MTEGRMKMTIDVSGWHDETVQTDKRPDPKPRKHPLLWQTYLWWHELMEMRKRHNLRISSAEKGKSMMHAQFERDTMNDLNLEENLKSVRKSMIEYGEGVGPIWEWTTSIKGLKAGSMAAQLLAQIDDIGKFDTVSKLWAFSGWAVKDGKRQWPKKGQKSPYNRTLKSIGYLIGDQFIKQQTPLYVDEYYKEKDRLRRLYPEPVKTDGPWPTKYTDSHIHRMARRKMIKMFLQHLWVTWRGMEGLSMSLPWILREGSGHSNYIEPPSL